jgi:hypothetical protein
MKTSLCLIITCVMCAFISSCTKKPNWDIEKNYSVEGFLLRKDETPIAYRAVALSQKYDAYSLNEPTATTDSNGYFKIYYTPSGSKDGLTLHHVQKDYLCVTTELAILKNLSKGKNLNVGKVYTE